MTNVRDYELSPEESARRKEYRRNAREVCESSTGGCFCGDHGGKTRDATPAENTRIRRRMDKSYDREDIVPSCPNCHASLKRDPGDGSVHEPSWYCDRPNCYYNDRAFETAALVVGMDMLRRGKTTEDVNAKIKEMHSR